MIYQTMDKTLKGNFLCGKSLWGRWYQ